MRQVLVVVLSIRKHGLRIAVSHDRNRVSVVQRRANCVDTAVSCTGASGIVYLCPDERAYVRSGGYRRGKLRCRRACSGGVVRNRQRVANNLAITVGISGVDRWQW
jgi:hypothetical protein